MSLPSSGWSNVTGSADKTCKCGTWKKHWINFSEESWPPSCSKSGCSGSATLGAHIKNSSVSGVRIVPFCDSCNGLSGTFSLKGNIMLPSATASDNCGKRN